ncbi:MAG TPA: CPBP family intramembrane glutamic endopeptidase [Clostridia bacterium]|nr:CPBP family intramembrane glutamic endopeptidase [Clostridia bacterium]
MPTNTFRNISPSRRIAVLVVGYALLECALWTSRPAQFAWSALFAAWVVGTVVASRPTLAELGLGVTGLRASAWVVAAASALALLMLAAAATAGTLHPLFGLIPQIPHSLLYVFWAFQQQFILQCFFFLNLQSIVGTKRAVVLASVLFAFAHLPNPVLTVGTLVTGVAFCAAFARYRNLYALAAAHAVLGLAVALSLPDDVHRHMRVGLGWLRYVPSQTTLR